MSWRLSADSSKATFMSRSLSLARSASADAASSVMLGYASSSLSAVAAELGVQAATMAEGTRVSGLRGEASTVWTR